MLTNTQGAIEGNHMLGGSTFYAASLQGQSNHHMMTQGSNISGGSQILNNRTGGGGTAGLMDSIGSGGVHTKNISGKFN